MGPRIMHTTSDSKPSTKQVVADEHERSPVMRGCSDFATAVPHSGHAAPIAVPERSYPQPMQVMLVARWVGRRAPHQHNSAAAVSVGPELIR